MDAILARVGVSDAQLHTHCLEAVRDELQQVEKRLQKSLSSLRRALQVTDASRELHKSPLSLVDASPDVSNVLTRVVTCCNEVGPLVRKLHLGVSVPGTATINDHDDVSSSSTEDESEAPTVERHEICNIVAEPTAESQPSQQEDSSLLDERREVPAPSSSQNSTLSIPLTPTPPIFVYAGRRVARSARGRNGTSQSLPPRIPSSRKRKTPERFLDPLVVPVKKKLNKQDLFWKRLELPWTGELSDVVRRAFFAACDGMTATSITRLQEACHELVEAKDRGNDVTSYMDDIQAILSVIVPDASSRQLRLDRQVLRSTLVLIQRLPREFPETAKLRRYIAGKYVTPAEEVTVIRDRLDEMLEEVRGWCRDDTYSVGTFEDRLQFIKDTMEGLSYEGYEPHWDRTIAELLFRLGCCLRAFETGWAQDRRYDTIRFLLFKMNSAERPRAESPSRKSDV